MPNAVPIEGRFAANVQAFETSLEEPEAGVKVKRNIGTGEHSPGQALEPPSADIVNSQVGRNAESGQFLRCDRPAGADLLIESV